MDLEGGVKGRRVSPNWIGKTPPYLLLIYTLALRQFKCLIIKYLEVSAHHPDLGTSHVICGK